MELSEGRLWYSEIPGIMIFVFSRLGKVTRPLLAVVLIQNIFVSSLTDPSILKPFKITDNNTFEENIFSRTPGISYRVSVRVDQYFMREGGHRVCK